MPVRKRDLILRSNWRTADSGPWRSRCSDSWRARAMLRRRSIWRSCKRAGRVCRKMRRRRPIGRGARLAGETRAAGLSDHLTRLTQDARAALAERLLQDLTAQVGRGEMQALVGLGRIEMELRSPARLQEATLWFALAAAFEVRHAIVLREAAIRDLEPAQRLSVQERAGAEFGRLCRVLAIEDRPRSCATE